MKTVCVEKKCTWPGSSKMAVPRCPKHHQRFINGTDPEPVITNLPPVRKLVTGTIYVIEFSTGVIKVGRTTTKQKRLEDHTNMAFALGIEVVHVHTQRTNDLLWAERELIAYCRSLCKEQRRHEYFIGLDFPTIVNFAESLTD